MNGQNKLMLGSVSFPGTNTKKLGLFLRYKNTLADLSSLV